MGSSQSPIDRVNLSEADFSLLEKPRHLRRNPLLIGSTFRSPKGQWVEGEIPIRRNPLLIGSTFRRGDRAVERPPRELRRNPLLVGSTFRRAVCSAPSKLHFPPFSSPNRPSPRPLAGHSEKLAKKAHFLTFQCHSATPETPPFLAFPPFPSISEAPAKSRPPPRFVRGRHRYRGIHKSAIPNPCVGSEPPERDATGVSSPFLQEPVSVPGNEIPRRAHRQARLLG